MARKCAAAKNGVTFPINLPEWRKRLVVLVLVFAGCLVYMPPGQGGEERITLPSEPQSLTDKDIERLVREYDFCDKRLNPRGRFSNRFVPARYGNDPVIFDHTTGLAWQQSGSSQYMDWKAARTYIQKLNAEGFAGFSGWRLPTVTELASLLRPSDGTTSLHVDQAFDPHQAWCWSSDQRGEGFAYLVSFYHGMIDWKFECGLVFVRAVASAAEFQSRRQEPETISVGRPSGTLYTNSVGMKFALIPAGSFRMGSPEEEPGRTADEGPRHHVAFTKPFYLGVTEVTQGQWRAVMDDNPSFFRAHDLPVENVSWDECREFIRRLNEREKTNRYRLPSEAEWEYACRAGSDRRFSFGEDVGAAVNREKLRYYFGDEGDELGAYAWYGNVSGNETHPVGLKKPNSWGLYDMHGNVAEWCKDWYGPYPAEDQTDPEGSAQGTFRVLRGGGFGFGTWSVRSARRDHQPPQSRSAQWGLRVVVDAE